MSTVHGVRRRLVILAAGLGLVLAATSGCTGQRQAAPGASAPRSAWETVLAGIGQNGEVDQQTATQAFSLAVAPLPGVTVPNGPEVQIRSGSAAIRWVLGYLAQLPADLQQAVKGWLDRAKADGTTVRQARAPAQAPVRGPLRAPATPSPASNDLASLSVLVAQAIDEIEKHLGRPLHEGVEVSIGPAGGKPKDLGGAFSMDANRGLEGPPAICHIELTKLLFTKSHNAVLETVYHEVFHCFAAEMFPNLKTYYSVRPGFAWVIEGQAEWVGDSLAGSDEGTPYHWTEYLSNPGPGKSLFGRSYDALGFYSHLDNSGGNPWKVIDPMLKAVAGGGGNEGAFAAALGGGDSKIVLDSWPSGYARGRRPGAAWNTTGPGITNDRPAVGVDVVTTGATVSVTAPPVANTLRQLDLRAEVTTFAVAGDAHGRLGPSSGDDVVLSALAGTWCTRSDGRCSCPPDSAGAGTDLPKLAPGVAWLALTGGLGTATATVTGLSAADQCKKKSDKTACLVGTWTSTSATLDGRIGHFTGGAGVVLRFAPNGDASADFDGMQPITGTITLPSASAGLSYRYTGKVTFKVVFAPNGTAKAESTQGTISAHGVLSLGRSQIPIDMPLSDLATSGSPAAGAIDAHVEWNQRDQHRHMDVRPDLTRRLSGNCALPRALSAGMCRTLLRSSVRRLHGRCRYIARLWSHAGRIATR